MTQPELSLYNLLRDQLFAGEASSYRHWLETLPDVENILPHLPGENAPLAELIHSSIILLRNRGRIDAEFFRRLFFARPGKRDSIASVQIQWGIIVSGWQPPDTQPSLKNEPRDITQAIIENIPEIQIGPHHSQRMRILNVRDKANWRLGSPFSPPLTLYISSRLTLSVPTPNYLTISSQRKVQTISLKDGPTDFTAVQSQPSVRKSRIYIHRGVSETSCTRISLGATAVSVSSSLTGQLFILSAPEVDALLQALWFTNPL